MTADDGQMSRRQALGYGAVAAGVAAGGLVASPAAATTGAAAEAASDEAVDAMSHREPVALQSVSLAQANRLVRRAVAYVEERGLPPMYVLVVDVCGDPKASRRMDRNGRASLALVPPKAATALGFRTDTLTFGAGVTDPGRIASFTTAGFSLLGGGRPIVVGDEVIGAIAVGGGSPEQDDEVAAAALEAL